MKKIKDLENEIIELKKQIELLKSDLKGTQEGAQIMVEHYRKAGHDEMFQNYLLNARILLLERQLERSGKGLFSRLFNTSEEKTT